MNKDTAVVFLGLIISGKIEQAFTDHVGIRFKHHNPFFHGDGKSLAEAMEGNHMTYPNKLFEVQHVIADGPFVAVHSRLRMNADDTEISVVHIFRFEQGKIVELWDVAQVLPTNSPNENGAF